MNFIFFLAFLGAASPLDKAQIKGLKNLVKNLDQGIFPTCNIVLFSEMVDFDTAERNCQTFDIGSGVTSQGNLATVNDEDKNSDLMILLDMAYPYDPETSKWGPDKWVWAGLRKTQNNEGSQNDKIYNAEDWQWAEGDSPTDFHKWMNKQPDQRALNNGDDECNEEPKCYQNQMRINHQGKWDDTFKHKLHPYACDYQGKYVISATLKNWHASKEACEEAGLVLAKVRSSAEVTEFVTVAEFFLGPRDESQKEFHSSNWIWIGGNDLDEEGVWRWADNELVVDWGIPWRRRNPDNAMKLLPTGQDVMAVSKWGLFDDSYELGRKRPFACQCPGT